jgi:predicted nucleic-acid-binding Zn-ribbon protein
MSLPTSGYRCSKCDHNRFEVGEIRATGGFWSKIFNVQNKKFSTVTCSKCRFTEMYQADSSKLGNLFDLFTSG